MSEAAITAEQYSLYQQESVRVQMAQSRLELCLSTILAGHSITNAHIEKIEPDKITYSTTDESDRT